MLRTRVALLGLAGLLTGCGGQERSPGDVARAYVGGDGPARCEDASLRFLEQQTGESGDAARAACRRAARRLRPPADVRVTRDRTQGDRAEVVLEAGGQEVVVGLERGGDGWLVTRIGR